MPCCGSSASPRRCCRCSAGSRPARTADDEPVLFFGDEVVNDGAVGVRLDGVEVLPMRVAGRGADRPRADDHRRRGARDRRAGRASRRWRSCSETIEELPPRTCGWSRAACWSGSSSTRTSRTTCRATSSSAGSSAPIPATGQVSVAADVHPGPGRAAARARRRERRSRPARGVVDPDDRAGRPPAGGRAAVRVQRPRPEHVRARGSRRRGGRRRARGRPGRRVLRRRRDRPRRRRATSCTASRPRVAVFA